MFNRGGGGQAQGPAPVEITLEDGQELHGKLLLPPGRTLVDVLNGTATFVEFEVSDGERMYIAKSALHCVKPMNVPPAPDLWAGPTDGGNFDPYAVLGIGRGATQEDAREAYVGLAKVYHPDRYAAVELPKEVRDYLAVMARRINAAYQTLDGERKRKEVKREPVFQKAGF
jgi:hypothetical protein